MTAAKPVAVGCTDLALLLACERMMTQAKCCWLASAQGNSNIQNRRSVVSQAANACSRNSETNLAAVHAACVYYIMS